MRIVNVLGGLGNQMFQYALYVSLKQKFPKERVLVDLHCFNGYHKHRGIEIDKVFNISFEQATLRETAHLAYPYPNFQAWRIGSRLLPIRRTMLKEKPNFTYEPTATTRTIDTYYDGYWQHEEYFMDIRPEILKTFTFPSFIDNRNRRIADIASTSNSCSIHIRRGDYLTDPLRKGTTGDDFALKAINEMQQRQHPNRWFVFSDDINWCRLHLSRLLGNNNTHYIDWNTGNNSIHDMHLMSLCRHNIIANSSFSWWGAWLSQDDNKCVIAPAIWMNMKDVASPVPHHWIKL